MDIAVVTRIPNPETSSGNMALAMDIWRVVEQPSESNDWMGRCERFFDIAVITQLRSQVFELGEILILDANERCIGGYRS